jgi:hypothetical protein
MTAYRSLMKLTAILLEISFTLTLSGLLAYALMNLGPVEWILHTRIGSDAHGWLLSAMGVEGIEYTLDSVIIMSFSAMLPPSIWLCRSLTRYLLTVKLRAINHAS